MKVDQHTGQWLTIRVFRNTSTSSLGQHDGRVAPFISLLCFFFLQTVGNVDLFWKVFVVRGLTLALWTLVSQPSRRRPIWFWAPATTLPGRPPRSPPSPRTRRRGDLSERWPRLPDSPRPENGKKKKTEITSAFFQLRGFPPRACKSVTSTLCNSDFSLQSQVRAACWELGGADPSQMDVAQFQRPTPPSHIPHAAGGKHRPPLPSQPNVPPTFFTLPSFWKSSSSSSLRVDVICGNVWAWHLLCAGRFQNKHIRQNIRSSQCLEKLTKALYMKYSIKKKIYSKT